MRFLMACKVLLCNCNDEAVAFFGLFGIMNLPNQGGNSMDLSEKLIVLRKERGWSQEDFAEKLEVSRQAISRWENGTTLPDAQNILRISKLFNVTADYLLNDGYERESDMLTADSATEEDAHLPKKKKQSRWYLIPAICGILLIAYFAVEAVKPENTPAEEVHTHPELIRVIENEVAPTCTEQGYYDEVLYCAQCRQEVLRTRILKGVPSHQFENQKCIVCGKDQRERN